jgi:hypothetical protein
VSSSCVNGGASRDRTDDPLLAKQVLSQLSYGPNMRILVGLGRFELPTSPLSGVRSNQLSYRPEFEYLSVFILLWSFIEKTIYALINQSNQEICVSA